METLVRLTNTLTGNVDPLEPVTPGAVTIYVCGVTPYAAAHVGHAMSLMVYDVLVRYLRWSGNPVGGYQVTFASNYTDVDDKLILRGRELEVDPLELASQNIDQWEREQQLLGLILPDVRPRVTLEIDNITAMIEEIIAHDLAYVTPDGDVYFRVRDKRDYGKLSHRNIDQLRQGTRFEPGDQKEYALDFALWKAVTPTDEAAGEPAWPAPWRAEGEPGHRGRPGWHIECSAMARRYLGETFDIHGGGLDLIFPHHENEIAQAEAAAGDPSDRTIFAKVWMHNGMVTRDNTKMSKSLGNIVSVEEALERWGPDPIRMFVLTSHYRASNNLTNEAMAAATAAANRLATALHRETATGNASPDTESTEADRIRAAFVEAMEDDLATPRALATLFELATLINRQADAGQPIAHLQSLLRELTGVLGLTLPDPAAGANVLVDAAAVAKLAAELNVACAGKDATGTIEALIAARADARASKDFARGDAIRDGLAEVGVVLEDGAAGTRWSLRR